MKRIVVATAIAIIIAAFQFCQGQPYPFAGKTSVVVEASLMDYQGEGNMYRLSFYKGFFRSIHPLDLFEFGLGLQYFKKDPGSTPWFTDMLEPVVLDRDRLIDYFLFGGARINLPAFTFLRFYLGTRVGLHFIDRDYYWHSGGYTYREDYSYRGKGIDLYAGIKLGVLKFPVGLQLEGGGSRIEAKYKGYDSGSYVSLGIYLEY